MQQPSWERIQEIYHSAVALPRSDRDAFVAEACAGDSGLEREVKSLLKAHDSSGILDSPVCRVSSEPDDVVGKTINDRYLVEKKLKRGGMGQVYYARDLKINGRVVVIKFLLRELLEDTYARQKFRQEAEALSRIRHAGVVDVLDTGESDGRPFFVMQYVDGETLDQQIEKGAMPLDRVASILKQIGAALEHVHQQGVFHRDLKPTNIMLRRGTDSVVLVDFGIAKVTNSVVASSTAIGISAGTPLYMSPEQLRGEEITAASDIYSMALIAFEMVTGERPFNPTSTTQLLELQRAGVEVKSVASSRRLSHKAQDILLRGLEYQAATRYRNANEFGNSLAQALLDSGSIRKPWVKVVISLLGVLLLSSGIYKYCIGQIDPPPPNRSFNYWLTVKQNGQPSNSFQSHGEDDVFANGDQFQLTVVTPVPAYLYIFYERPPELNENSFKMIYPNQRTNNGSPSLGANQPLQLDWMTFRGPEGTENFWLVWSASPVGELDAVISEAFKQPDGGLTGQTQITVKQFLMAKKSEIDAITYNYNDNRTAVVRGKHDMLVTLAQFKHR